MSGALEIPEPSASSRPPAPTVTVPEPANAVATESVVVPVVVMSYPPAGTVRVLPIAKVCVASTVPPSWIVRVPLVPFFPTTMPVSLNRSPPLVTKAVPEPPL